MKKVFIVLTAVIFTLALTLPAFAGNGAPSGAHYNLNLIGVPKAKTASLTNSDRHTIFVKLGTTNVAEKSYIYLTQGPFQVCDGNSWDYAYDCNNVRLGTKIGSVFQLPCNDAVEADAGYECTGISSSYSVWVRSLGKPGGSGILTLCAYDTDTSTEYCNTDENVVSLSRSKGKQQFKNVTNELTLLQADIDGDTVLEKVALFQGGLEDWYWTFDNKGLKLTQLRFYPN